MKRLMRAAFVMAVVSAPVLGLHSAFASDPSSLFTCPSTLGGLPLTDQSGAASQSDPWFGEHGASFFCEYQIDGGLPLGDRRLSAGVIWEENAVSPEHFYCRADQSSFDDVGSNGHEIDTLSADRRALSIASESTDYGGSHAIPIQPAVDLAAKMLPLAEARAAPCPGASQGGATGAGGMAGGDSATTGETGDAGTQADAGGSGGSGTPLVVGGLLATAAGAVGSVLLGKGGGLHVAPPPADKLFSGQEAIDLLHRAGMIEPVLDATGRPIGYRPLGDLQQMLDAASPWQPEFVTPLATPDGGTATHLSGVAFQPEPDGTISSITVAIRPGGGAAIGATTPPSPTPASSESPQPPGVPLADQLYIAGIEAVAKGIPFDAQLDLPDRPPGPSLADSVYVTSIETSAEYLDAGGPISALPRTTPTGSTRPPADPGSLDQWLTTAGGKTITPDDLHALAPNLIGKGGTVRSGLYKGGQVTASIGDGGVNVTLRSSATSDSPLDIGLPDIEINATLTTNAGRLVATVQGQDAQSLVTKAVQKQLDGLNSKLAHAGLGIDQLEIVKGAIKMQVGPVP